jgi:UMF1 family MFS transporter
MYDWANSVFSLTIATAIFPIYFEAVTKHAAIAQGSPANGPYELSFLGLKFVNTALYSYAVAFGFLVVAFISPVLSGIADVRKNKLGMLKFFCYLGSLSCALLYFFDGHSVELGVLGFITGLIGFAGSIVFYNAFLPEITTPDQFDRVSAKGFSMGYIGSVILLVINLVTIMMPDLFFPVESYATGLMTSDTTLLRVDALKLATSHYEGIAGRLSFVMVAIWWAGFAQITFRNLPEEKNATAYDGNVLLKGWQELRKVWLQARREQYVRRYLLGFFFTSMGVQTVMYVASLFGSKELGLPASDLIVTILIIQLIAVGGAMLFSRLSARIGNIYTLIVTVLVWILICVLAWFVDSAAEFYGLGALVGIVMGGIQSMFRSTYAKLIPTGSEDHASWFSFYDVCEKFAIVLGTFSYGLIEEITGSMRNSIVALVVFFIMGLFFISRIRNFKVLHES